MPSRETPAAWRGTAEAGSLPGGTLNGSSSCSSSSHEGSEEMRELYVRLRLQKHYTPPEAKQAAGRRAKPAPARAQVVK